MLGLFVSDSRINYRYPLIFASTGKSLSEALILVSTNAQYDKIELPVQHMEILSSEHVENMLRTSCVHKLFWMSKQKEKTICVHNMFSKCSELGIFMYWTGNSMNNLSPYCGLVDARISTSDKYLPVLT